MANSKLLREAVVILGAGTQGRRLAYMVRIRKHRQAQLLDYLKY